jgi:predicted DCC family thiol-disulfide oxidoreductase YuxK
VAPLPVLYDADCGFCMRSLGRLLRRDDRGGLRPVALQDPEAAQLLAALTPAQRMAAAHVVTADGAIHSGGDAVAPILAALGRPRAAAAARGAAPLLRVGYRAVAGRRALFGRLLRR